MKQTRNCKNFTVRAEFLISIRASWNRKMAAEEVPIMNWWGI